MMSKLSILGLGLVFGLGALSAQTFVWQPSPGHTQVPIWPGVPPDQQPVSGLETATWSDRLFGDRLAAGLSPVSQPTMTVYPPTGRNTGVAVVVFPGGGYQGLAIDLEGTDVCDWLTPKGITCVLLKYRVPGAKLYPKSAPYPKSGPYPRSPIALEDAQRTLRLVRLHAAEWHIDPHKIGVLGFSSGGHLVVATSTAFDDSVYAPVDAADKQSCRPDFAVAIYPGHLLLAAAQWDAEQGVGWSGARDRELWPTESTPFALNPDIHVTAQTPPTFLLQAENDPSDSVENTLVYFDALKKVGVPAEMHLYAQGGHAFGLRRTKLPITEWPQLVETWLVTIGMISQ